MTLIGTLRSLFNAFHWPTLAFQLMVWGFERTWINAAVIPAAFVFDYIFFLATDSYLTQRRKKNVLNALDQLKDCTLSEIPLRSIVSEQGIREFYRGVYSPDLAKSYIRDADPIDRQVRTFVINPNGDMAPPIAATAIQQLDGNCVIFVADPLEEMTSYQRFELLHELGHATKRNATQLSRLAGLVLFQWFCLWVFVLLGHKSWISFGLAVGLLATLRQIRINYPHSPQNLGEAAFHNELAADYFAVTQSDRSDLTFIEPILMDVDLPDPRLNDQTNLRRKAALIESVRLRVIGKPLPPPPFHVEVPRFLFLINLLILAALAYLGQHNSISKLIWIYGMLVLMVFLSSEHIASTKDEQAAIHAKLDQLAGLDRADKDASPAIRSQIDPS